MNEELDKTYPSGYIACMLEVRKTAAFGKWLDGLRDTQARARIQARIERLTMGNPGDVRPVAEGVSELRVDFGPGYRIYFRRIGVRVLVLLAGGNKKSQVRDIKAALRISRNL